MSNIECNISKQVKLYQSVLIERYSFFANLYYKEKLCTALLETTDVIWTVAVFVCK